MPRYARRKLRRGRRQFPGVRRTGKRFRRGVRRVVYNLAETKFFTQTININDQATVPTAISWSQGLAQGTGNAQRVGRAIRVKNLSFKMWVNLRGAGAIDAQVRVLVVYPRKGIDDQSVLSEIQLITFSSRPDPATLMVLYDKWMTVGNAANSSTPIAKPCFFSKKCRYVFNFDVAGAVKVEPILVFVSSLAAADVSNVNLQGYLSMSYKDL